VIAHGIPIYLALEPVDMRFGAERLGAFVRERMRTEPRARALFAFVGKRGHTMKVLTWDGTGTIVIHKKLLCRAPHKSLYAEPVVMRSHGCAGLCRSSASTSVSARAARWASHNRASLQEAPCSKHRSRHAPFGLRRGPAGPYVDAFVQSLELQGYSSVAIEQKAHFLVLFMDWMAEHGGDDFVAGLRAYKQALAASGQLRDSKGRVHRATSAGARFVQFLRGAGIARAPEARRDVWPILGEYHVWALQHRGLAATTLHLYEDVLVDLVATLGTDPSTYTAKGLRDHVLDRARPHGLRRGETIVCAVRSFLRFLVATGRCSDGMPDAIPRFASWRLSSLPRYLEHDDVQRVIDACALTTSVRYRDRAILLLLSRLGLRGGDVAGLTFEDFDWRNARVAMSGKSRRREWLPVPQDVGEAILDYCRHGRPISKVSQVFVTARAPHRPLTNSTVSRLAGAAIRRAGVASPNHGAHVFRHSAATAMLRQGVSLPSIGAVLRHRLPDTTLQYAKVDFASLAEVAMPWPGVSPC
jgi:integrase/recombinase XerD